MGADTIKPLKRVYRTEDDFKSLNSSWNKLVKTAGADVFQLHEWQYSWWNVFGSNNELHIITYWIEDELIAILPFFIQDRMLSRFRFIKTLQLIGSHITTAHGGILPVDKAFAGYLDIIVHPDHFSLIQDEIPELFSELIMSVDQIILDEIPEHSLIVHSATDLKQSNRWKFDLVDGSSCSHCLIDSDWDLYLSTLSRSTRKHIRRGLRSIYDEHLFEIKQAKNTEEFEWIFSELVRLHQDRWHHFDQPGIFADPRLQKFYHETSLHLFETGSANLHWAEKDGTIIAVELTYAFNHTIYAVQNGFDDTSEYSKYSPSNLTIYHIMKTGIENGYLIFDWLRGTESYKSSTTNLVLQNQKIILSAANAFSAFKVFISKHLSAFLTKSKNEIQVFSVYNDNYSFLNAKKNYTKRIVDQLKSRKN